MLLILASVGVHAAPRRVVLVSGEYEYTSALTLRALADQLAARPDMKVTVLTRQPTEDIPGLEALDQADLLITFIRRMTLPADQLAHFRRYVESGRPLIALRTSCHAFENWKDFDHEVLGGNYQNHYPIHALVHVEPSRAHDPLLRGVPAEFQTEDSLYRMSPLAADTVPLLFGTIAGNAAAREPMAWTRSYHGGRIFFTSLGAADDFRHEPFMNLLGNALAWALGDPALGQNVALRPIAPLAIHRITRAELPHYLGFSSYTLIDARSAEAYAAKHEKKAVHWDPTPEGAARQLQALDPNRNYVIYADTGLAAAALANRLHDRGFPVVNYLGEAYHP